jgi:hypothetical protein
MHYRTLDLSMHEQKPIFIGFSHRPGSAHAPHEKLSMPMTPQIKARQQLVQLRPADLNRLARRLAREEEAIATL